MTPPKKPVNVKHFCNIGDIISSLPGLKRHYELTNRKAVYCQQLNVPADYYLNAIHPTKDEKGNQVMCNQKMFDMIKPLLEHQPYIESMEVYNGQLISVDFDVVRKERFVNIPHQAIQQWLFLAYPDLACDLSKDWIEVGNIDISDCYLIHPYLATEPAPIENLHEKVIVNFTERYRNKIINYFFLRKYQDRLIFSGTENEYLIFCKEWGLEIPRLVVKDFLQLAYIIKRCKFLLCNQSFQWNLSFAMHTPHVLELFEFADNCQCFMYEDSYGFYHQPPVEYFFKKLLTK